MHMHMHTRTHTHTHAKQIEMSPYTIYPGIVKFCQENDIVIEAYSQMASIYRIDMAKIRLSIGLNI